MESPSNNFKLGLKVSLFSIILNIFLSIFKAIAGIFGNSTALISDAVHSASDVVSTIIVIIGIKISDKPYDKKHPYGHERFESIIAIMLSFILCITGFMIGYSGIISIINKSYINNPIPSTITIIAAITSIIVKEIQYYITIAVAKKTSSESLKADAWHHRSDSLSSIGALIGVIAARFGYAILDPIASLIICIFIFKVSYDIINDSVSKLIDKSCDDCEIEEFKKVISQYDNIMRLDDMKSRIFGNKIFLDIEIAVDGSLSLNEAHEIAENLHDQLEYNFPKIKHCMVHVNPYK